MKDNTTNRRGFLINALGFAVLAPIVIQKPKISDAQIQEKLDKLCDLYSQLNNADRRDVIDDMLARAVRRKDKGDPVGGNSLAKLAVQLVKNYGG